MAIGNMHRKKRTDTHTHRHNVPNTLPTFGDVVIISLHFVCEPTHCVWSVSAMVWRWLMFQCWLDHGKPIIKQINVPELVFRFLVKFYTPDPELLEEELTRSCFDDWWHLVFYTHNAVLTRCMLWPCVWLSQIKILSEQLNTSSWFMA